MRRTVCKETGYCKISLRVDGKSTTHRVHRLILEAFVGPGQPGDVGCHYPDHNRRNCSIANLRWDTHQENIRDIAKLGRVRKGEQIPSAKMTPEKVLEIRSNLSSGHSIRRIARDNNVDPQTIRRIAKRQTWNHV